MFNLRKDVFNEIFEIFRRWFIEDELVDADGGKRVLVGPRLVVEEHVELNNQVVRERVTWNFEFGP